MVASVIPDCPRRPGGEKSMTTSVATATKPQQPVKGDIYLVAGDSEKHPVTKKWGKETGIVFQAIARNQAIGYMTHPTLKDLKLDGSTKGDGYYLLTGDVFGGFSDSSKAEADILMGILILRDADKKKIAAALRERFGEGSVLLTEFRCPLCHVGMAFVNGGFYRCLNCSAVVQPQD